MMRCGKAQSLLKETMEDMNLDYVEAEGEAAFYGPKLDVQVKTALGKDETYPLYSSISFYQNDLI